MRLLIAVLFVGMGLAAPARAQNDIPPAAEGETEEGQEEQAMEGEPGAAIHVPRVPLSPEDAMADIVAKAVTVRPTPRQAAWQELEFTCFIHFGVNTFTNREWGDGSEDPAIFNPSDFDAAQWVEVCKSAGMKMLILNTKHHDGFCLWPSKYTEHSVRNSPWRGGQGDLVREVADACHAAGLKFGIYLSPWDRHESSYGTPEYNEYFKNQLRELLTNYGPVADVWLDGANGEGPNGKRQEYDWDGYFAVVRELAPQATISIVGPDVRWCGNEAGEVRGQEWSVVASTADAMGDDLGSRAVLMQAAQQGGQLYWAPAQVNTSIRPGWFYHASEDTQVKSLDHLLDVYFGSVGGNAQFLLNIPPGPDGRIHETDAERMRQLGTVLDAAFEVNLASGARITGDAPRSELRPLDGAHLFDGDLTTYWMPADGVEQSEIVFELPGLRTFNVVMLQEAISRSQRVEQFAVDIWKAGVWTPLTQGATIGYKKLLRLDNPATTTRVRVRIGQSRVAPTLAEFGLFLMPRVQRTPSVFRDAAGKVHIEGQPDETFSYRINTGPTAQRPTPYKEPFELLEGGVVQVWTQTPERARYVDFGEPLYTEVAFGPAKRAWVITGASSYQNAERDPWKAIDDDPATFWHTDRSLEKTPVYGHELRIDLGAQYILTGFSFLPRQDHAPGRAVEYEFYVSNDAEEWPEPIVVDRFDNMENNAGKRLVYFPAPVRVRYVRMNILSTVDGKPWTAVGELDVLVHPKPQEEKPPAAAGDSPLK